MDLFEIVMPETDETEKLYVHRNDNIYRFDTYFNSFPVLKFLKYTILDNLVITLEITGSATVEIYTQILDKDGEIKEKRIISDKIGSIEKNSFDFFIDLNSLDTGTLQNIIVYPVVTLHSGGILHSGRYCTNQENINHVHSRIVFCTYKREKYILKNAEKISKYIVENELENELNVLVVDNGNTLNDLELKNVEIAANKNTGGSGGFARGMNEAVQDKRGFTHVILMDDDVEFDGIIFKKLAAFLKLAKAKNICVGGGMLVLERPCEQFECGANVDGWELKGNNMLIDLSVSRNVIENDICKKIDFNGWWFMCIPVEVIRSNGLPLPVFIKYDDVEYAFRCKSDTVTLNGVSVWHEMFEKKYRFSTEYYIARNRLIFMAVHAKRFGYFDFLRHLFDEVYEKLICYQYDTAELILRAYSDFLKGAGFLMETDAERLHFEVSKYDKKIISYRELDNIEYSFDEKEYRKSLAEIELKRNMKSRITLNGIFIPKRHYINPELGYRVADLFSHVPNNFYCTEKVLLYNIHGWSGVILKADKKRFFILLFGLICCICKSAAFWRAKKSFFKKTEEMRKFFENK